VEGILIFAALLCVVVVSVMLAAQAFGAGRRGIGVVALCVFVQAALTQLSSGLAGGWPVQFLVSFLGGALIYALILDTSFVKGIAIGLLSSALIVAGLRMMVTGVGLGPAPDEEAEQADLSEMQTRARESEARAPAYHEAVTRVLFIEPPGVRKCTELPHDRRETFDFYLEILPDGRAGRTRLEPLSIVGQCMGNGARNSHFPPPPGGAYVAKFSIQLG